MIARSIKKSWLHAKTKPRFVAALLVWLIVLATPALADRTPEPIVYTISFSAPENQYAGSGVQTPEDLQSYDPKLFDLLRRVYEDHHIPMDVYYGKNIPPKRSQ